MDNFINVENDLRTVKLKTNTQNTRFIENMNENLKNLEDLLGEKTLSDFPNIFVVGLPRSGTTLLMQLMIQYFDVSYINNLIARFWKTPLCGVSLFKSLNLTEKYQTGKSFYGKTSGIFGVHEFSYFWINYLNMGDAPPYIPKSKEKVINWDKLNTKLSQISTYFNKPTIYKGLHPALFANKLIDYNPKTFFIFIDRDWVDISASLFRARIEYYGDPNVWWSSVPENWEELRNLNYWDQIPAQIFYLHKQFIDQLNKNENNYIYTSYEKITENPEHELNMIFEKANKIINLSKRESFNMPMINKPTKRNFQDIQNGQKMINKINEYRSLL